MSVTRLVPPRVCVNGTCPQRGVNNLIRLRAIGTVSFEVPATDKVEARFCDFFGG